MDATTRIQSLENQVEKLGMKIDALCKALKLECEYTPHSYDVYQAPEEDEVNGQ